jgi:hypothetical protein
MFIVLHKPTGKYFKKHNWRKRSEPVVVEKSKARIYRTKGAAKISVGNWVYLTQEQRRGRNFGYYELDESIWEILQVSIEIQKQD